MVKKINEAKNIYLCPALVKGKYIIRFAVCAKSLTQEDVEYSWHEIQRLGDQVLRDTNETKFKAMSLDSSSPPAITASDKPNNSTGSHQIIDVRMPSLVKGNANENSAPCPPRLNDLKMAYTNLLEAAGEDIHREGLVKTPERAAKAFQFFTAGYHQNLKGEINVPPHWSRGGSSCND